MTSETNLIKILLNTSGEIISYNPILDYIGRGVLGDVYKTTFHQEAIIVKTPRESNRLPQFEQEIALLMDLAGKTPFVPKIETGIAQDSRFPVITMPFFDKKDRYSEKLSELLAKKDYYEAERLTLQIASAFCDAMIALHLYVDPQTQKPYACTDRKVNDFYLINNQPMIIDWNVLVEHTPESRNAEIRVFGTLLHEAYFGAKGKIPYEPFNDSRWYLPNDTNQERGVLSVGLRYLLARMVKQTSYYAEKSRIEFGDETDYFKLLKADLKTWQGCLINPDSFTIKAGLGITQDHEVTAIYQDLMFRQDKGGNSKERATALMIAHDAGRSVSEKIRGQILDGLRFDIKDGIKALDTNAVHGESDPILGSHIARWKLLLSVAEKGVASLDTGEARKKSEIRDLVSSLGGGLHTDGLLSQKQVSDLTRDYNRLYELLSNSEIAPIGKEVALYTQAEAFNRESRFEERAEILKGLHWTPHETPHLSNEFLSQLLNGYVIEEFYDELGNPIKIWTPQAQRLYATLQSASSVEGWGGWVEGLLAPIRQSLQFIDSYDNIFGDGVAINPNDLYRYVTLFPSPALATEGSPLLVEAKTILSQLAIQPKLEPLFKENIVAIAKNYYDAAIAEIKRATTSPVQWHLLLKAQVLVRALEQQTLFNLSDEGLTALSAYHDYFNANQALIRQIDKIATTDTTALPTIAQDLSKLIEQVGIEKLDLATLTQSPAWEYLVRDYEENVQRRLLVIHDTIGEIVAQVEQDYSATDSKIEALLRKVAFTKEDIETQLKGLRATFDAFDAQKATQIPLLEQHQQTLDEMKSVLEQYSQLIEPLPKDHKLTKAGITNALDTLLNHHGTIKHLWAEAEAALTAKNAQLAYARQVIRNKLSELQHYIGTVQDPTEVMYQDLYGYLRVAIESCPAEVFNLTLAGEIRLLISNIHAKIQDAKDRAKKPIFGKSKHWIEYHYEYPARAIEGLNRLVQEKMASISTDINKPINQQGVKNEF